MASKGVRRILQPLLYVGVALLAHGILFLIPSGKGGKTDATFERGVRIRAIGAPSSAPPAQVPSSTPPRTPHQAPVEPQAVAERTHSSLGGGTPGPGKETTGSPGDAAGAKGDRGTSDQTVQGGTGSPPQSEFGSYLARLRSEGVQGWARESAAQQRQGWRGSGKAAGTGWGGAGGGAGTGTTGGGAGTSPGAGGRGGGGTGYLDPRVKMVVTSYPHTDIERRHTQVPYPDIKFKKNQYTSGWWNVYVQLWTDGNGQVVRSTVLQPKTNGALEKIFVEQVKKEIDKWNYEQKEAEINVDVRFYVE